VNIFLILSATFRLGICRLILIMDILSFLFNNWLLFLKVEFNEQGRKLTGKKDLELEKVKICHFLVAVFRYYF
jgi:hypothetical protein